MAEPTYIVPGTKWKYEWWQAKQYINETGNNEFTGLLLPTPASCYQDSNNPVETFTWYHLAPVIGFQISRNNSKIRITPIPVINEMTDGVYFKPPVPYNGYPYSDGWSPGISFSYKDSSGNFHTIAKFSSEADYIGAAKESAEISGIDKAAIYVTCDATSCGLYNTQNLLAYIKLHTHIDKPDPPTISSSTGKTITVKNGKDGLYCTSNNDGWYDTPHTFTGLTQGKSYNFKCRENCPDCPDNKILESNTVTGRTWNISGQFVDSGAKSMTFKATHIAGTGGNVNSHTITYKLYTSKSTSGTAIATKTGNNGVPVTFTGLEPGKKYYCYAYTTNLGDGDNNCWIGDNVSTKEDIKVQGSTGDVSATTLRTSVSWSAGGAKSVTCTLECNGQSRSLGSSGSYVGFTGLSPGLNYTVSWRIVSKYDYTYTYTIIDEDGKEVEKTGTREETIETTGSSSYTTKESKFGSPVNVTSKIIQFKSNSNYPSDIMEQRISSNNSWDVVEQDTYFIYNNLYQAKTYTIYCRIAGCYAFDTSGNQTTFNDSELSKSVSTYLLTLNGSITEEHQHSIISSWQAYVNGVATDRDAIDGTAFEFTYMDTTARKANRIYQSYEVIEAIDGNTTGNYQYDKKVYSNNLTWYYCEYMITVSITDGFNITSAMITGHTTFPMVWLNTNGGWHRYMGYVYTNNRWVPAPIFVYKNGKFIEPNGE